ncbi:MAG: alpha/beta hydrolase [Leptolyngbyaceae cyanobacterium]
MISSELDQIRAMLQDFTWGDTIAEMRSNFNNGFSLPPHPMAQVTPIQAGGVAAELISMPQGSSDRIILYLHGGGFAMGSCQTYRRLAADLAAASNSSVLVIDYRLAPEHPYPAALEDTLTAYRWLIDPLRFSPNQVAIAGDSAGGNLALAALVSLRDTGNELPAAAILISPYCDQTQTSSTITTHAAVDPMVSPQLLDTVTRWYAPDADLKQPLISPLYADLSALPALLVHVGAAEVLLDDSLQLARQVGLANGLIELKVWKNMIHCFHLFAPLLTEGQQAIAEVAAFLHCHWRQETTLQPPSLLKDREKLRCYDLGFSG